MISKIIQKEKERQEEFLNLRRIRLQPTLSEKCYSEIHKQSLINLKEYLEETYDKFVLWTKHQINMKVGELYERDLIQLKEDLNEIELMIERYKNV